MSKRSLTRTVGRKSQADYTGRRSVHVPRTPHVHNFIQYKQKGNRVRFKCSSCPYVKPWQKAVRVITTTNLHEVVVGSPTSMVPMKYDHTIIDSAPAYDPAVHDKLVVDDIKLDADKTINLILLDDAPKQPEPAWVFPAEQDEAFPNHEVELEVDLSMTDDMLSGATKSDLLALAGKHDVKVFKSWTNARIVEALKSFRDEQLKALK